MCIQVLSTKFWLWCADSYHCNSIENWVTLMKALSEIKCLSFARGGYNVLCKSHYRQLTCSFQFKTFRRKHVYSHFVRLYKRTIDNTFYKYTAASFPNKIINLEKIHLLLLYNAIQSGTFDCCGAEWNNHQVLCRLLWLAGECGGKNQLWNRQTWKRYSDSPRFYIRTKRVKIKKISIDYISRKNALNSEQLSSTSSIYLLLTSTVI